MFKKISAQNSEWNRKYNFHEENGYGFYMDSKHGLAFFAWIFPDEAKFYKCEQGVFDKNFTLLDEETEYEFDPFDNVRFLRYPMD